MSAEVSRKEYGETEQGFVVVIDFADNADNHHFEVRHGRHTVYSGPEEKKADAIAKALTK